MFDLLLKANKCSLLLCLGNVMVTDHTNLPYFMEGNKIILVNVRFLKLLYAVT